MSIPQQQSTQHTGYLKEGAGAGINLDYKRMFFETIRHWWMFVITLGLAFTAVYMIHRYTKPVFSASMLILIEERGSEQPQNSMMEGFGLSLGMRNIDNQIAILRSWEMFRLAINELDFNLAYFKAGRVKDSEIYGTGAPFTVQIDSAAPQLINTSIYLHYIDSTHFQLTIDKENANTYVYKSESSGPSIENIHFSETFRYGEWIRTPWLNIAINNCGLNAPDESGYFFEFYNPNALASLYQSRFQAYKANENSSIIRLSITGYNSAKNILFLNTLAKVFIRNNLEKKNQIATNTINFIEEQLLNITDSLVQTGSALSKFRTDHQLQSVSAQADMLFARMETLNNQIAELYVTRNYHVYLKDYFSADTLLSTSIAPAVFPVQNTIISNQITSIIELNNDRLRYGLDKNPLVRELNEKLTVACQTLLNGINSQIQIIDSDINRLKSLLVETSGQLYQLPETERKLLGIEREFDLNNEVFTFLLRKRSESQIQKASNTPDHSVLEKASYAGQIHPIPASNRQKALIAGLLLPLLFIIAKELLYNKISGTDDIERLTVLPVIGHILHNTKDEKDVVQKHPKSVIAETFRRIRTRMEFLTKNVNSPVIAISSSMPGEGKTFCAYNMAAVFAIAGKRTVLVGFDLRKPGLNRLIKAESGISQYLINKAKLKDIIVPSQHENLSILPSGTIPPNPAELIASPRTAELFDELRNEFDIIIMDTPPMGIVSDGYMLTRYADSLVFLTRQGYTVKAAFVNTIKQMSDEGVHNIGILINDIKQKKGVLKYGYGYGYGYGRGYGYGYGEKGYGYYEE